eukprot:s864_g3.t1
MESSASTGSAKNLWVGIFMDQLETFERTGVLEPPLGRYNQYYWPLKATALHAATKKNRDIKDLFLIPITLTYVGLVAMLENGTLECVDKDQWRLYGPLEADVPQGYYVLGVPQKIA